MQRRIPTWLVGVLFVAALLCLGTTVRAQDGLVQEVVPTENGRIINLYATGPDGAGDDGPIEITRSSQAGVAFEAVGAQLRAQFPADSLGAVVATAANATPVSFSPAGLQVVGAGGTVLYEEAPMSASPVSDGQSVTYTSVYLGADDVFTPSAHRLKHDLVLHARPVLPAGAMTWRTLYWLEADGYVVTPGRYESISIANAAGTAHYRLPPIEAVDARGDAVTGTYTITRESGRLRLAVELESSWMSAAAYPVRVDPVIDVPLTGSNNVIPFGFGTGWWPNRFQHIYTATQLSSTAGTITDFGWQWLNPTNSTWPSIDIYMGETTLTYNTLSTTFDNNYDVAPAVMVYSGSYSVVTASGGAFYRVALQTPFAYSGTNNLIVEIRNGALGSGTNDVLSCQSGTSSNSRVYNLTSTTATTGSISVGYGYGGSFDISTGPEMDVQRPAGTSIADGGNDALGNVAFGSPTPYTYTIENTGGVDLNLTGTPLVSATANTNCTVNVTTQPTTPVTQGGGTTTFVVEVTVTAIGAFDFDISIDNDDPNENPYNFNVAGTGISAAEMDVQRPAGTSIADGGNDALGNVPATIATPYTYTIENTGTDDLNLTGTPLVSATANTNCSVNVTTQPTTPVAQGGGTTTFVVEVTVTAVGAFDFDISIDNDDADENPYNFNVAGTGILAPEIDLQRPAGTSIASGATDTVGNLSTTTPTDITYTIENTGVNTLNLLGAAPDYVTLSGEVNCTAIVFTQPTTPIAAGNTTTFIIRIQPTAAGACSVLVTILNDDTDEGTYTFTIDGSGVTTIGGGGGGCCTTSDPATHPGNAFLLLLAAVLLLAVPVIRRRS